ncbi:LacI family DNA-binding transcriptional regulator [Leifsonia sp. C5G2]|uniref:LacI family DNA-binding transcriptional regulator n=1 Tax=Leifsonia sp. C5G2 TaxID=2735269 RepID=UPI001584E58B|nr:LacI family DNA-binding transcriptional regulator [Leifsonia sp. C5G2]NUU07862.1 LacI family DNA-binding transcriptional regulator [Leifsonia sp. C5G2]
MIDVARLAGVSQQTVSRVVNGSPNVAPDVRDRVETAIQQLRYRRNPAARALANGRTMNIGIVSFGLAQYGPSVALSGIADEARKAGYATNLVTLGDVDRAAMKAALEHLVEDSVDGIVVLAPVQAALEAISGLDAGVPLVFFEPGASEGTRSVATDEVSGAELATRHLLDLGHETVWQVAGPGGWLGSDARLRGWAQTLASEGRVTNQVFAGDWSTRSGYAAGVEIAENPAITAVFVANDQMALGVIKALTDAGLRVPEDVSVVGFDDVPESQYYCPALTTIRLDFEEVGRLAVDRILHLMRGGQAGPLPRVSPTLVVRQSAAPPSRTP